MNGTGRSWLPSETPATDRTSRGGRLSTAPEPAIFGAQAAKPMYAAFYGELALHAAQDELSQDAYSLFYARSAAMGWLTPATEAAPGGLWGMNDAGASPGSGPQPQRVAFFQVTLTGPAPGGVLPAQPFLSCAGDVVARLGTLRLEAVQVLLPGQETPAGGDLASPSSMRIARPLLDTRNWFGDCDPQLRTPVRVTLDGGPDPSVRAAAPAIAGWAQEVRQDIFAFDSFSLADDDHLVLQPTPLHEPGPAPHRVTFWGTLTEWSLDALGWLAAFLTDISSRNGVHTPLMLTANRGDAPGSPAG
jgi:hypothetical protein